MLKDCSKLLKSIKTSRLQIGKKFIGYNNKREKFAVYGRHAKVKYYDTFDEALTVLLELLENHH